MGCRHSLLRPGDKACPLSDRPPLAWPHACEGREAFPAQLRGCPAGLRLYATSDDPAMCSAPLEAEQRGPLCIPARCTRGDTGARPRVAEEAVFTAGFAVCVRTAVLRAHSARCPHRHPEALCAVRFPHRRYPFSRPLGWRDANETATISWTPRARSEVATVLAGGPVLDTILAWASLARCTKARPGVPPSPRPPSLSGCGPRVANRSGVNGDPTAGTQGALPACRGHPATPRAPPSPPSPTTLCVWR